MTDIEVLAVELHDLKQRLVASETRLAAIEARSTALEIRLAGIEARIMDAITRRITGKEPG